MAHPCYRYGSIYFANDAFQGCHRALVEGTISEDLKEEVAERFVVGPAVERDFWSKERSTMDIDRGPCRWH